MYEYQNDIIAKYRENTIVIKSLEHGIIYDDFITLQEHVTSILSNILYILLDLKEEYD